MKKIYFLFLIAIILGGCAVNLRPSWIVTGERQLERYKRSLLTQGDGEITERYFQEAIHEIKKSGDLDLLEKAWLTRMALQTALLEEMNEADYLGIAAIGPVPENDNFCAFLKGDITEVEIKGLPQQYRGFARALLRGDIEKSGEAIASIKDEPVSRLIAAGIALNSGLESEAIIQAAAEAASINGWKAALTVWLERLAALHDADGNTGSAEVVRQRIKLMEE